MSALTAYLIVAYLAGKELTFSQTIIISGAFALMGFLCAFAATANTSRILEYARQLVELDSEREIAVTEPVLWAMRILMYFGILVALKFMWDVRHASAE